MIADLVGEEKIQMEHIADAIQYRSLDRKFGSEARERYTHLPGPRGVFNAAALEAETVFITEQWTERRNRESYSRSRA